MSVHSVFEPVLCIVDFHHARGPEIEAWIGVQEGQDPAVENDWSLLPFMALSDGAHASVEDFSYFTLRAAEKDGRPPTTLFGISCARQLSASELINRPADVTRSAVQKAVVVVTDSPQYFGHLREKLSIITKAWFLQKDFSDRTILYEFQESLAKSIKDFEGENDSGLGLSLRELVHEFRWQTLVLFKCLLLQQKMLFYGSNCERLCLVQFSLISLIPGLIRKLQDCADPAFHSNEKNTTRPSSVKISERSSLLAYMGLPLQLFGKGSLFGPYTPLQQLDMLADRDTKSYVVGSTNSLLLGQQEKYADVLVNLDDNSITINNLAMRGALTLTVPDRRWIDALTFAVNDTWDPANPQRPKTMGYLGSEEFIRLQFEEYLLALLAAVKYRRFVEWKKEDPKNLLASIEDDAASEFSPEWVDGWLLTDNYRVFQTHTDSHLFDIVEPVHPATGGLTMDDVQRRLATQVADLHLDEKFQAGREQFGKTLASGHKKVSTAFNNFWADVERMREEQRKKQEANSVANPSQDDVQKPAEMSQARATMQAASASAGAYLSSWGSWAAEKRRTGWGDKSTFTASTTQGNAARDNAATTRIA